MPIDKFSQEEFSPLRLHSLFVNTNNEHLCPKTQTSFSHKHPLSKFFALFESESIAMAYALEIVAKAAIYLGEANLENPDEVQQTMQGFRNLHDSMSDYHKQNL